MSQPSDKRKHARIESSLVCNIATATGVFDAVVANLSKGGAAIIAGLGVAEVGETVTLMLEREEGLVTLSLTGNVVRKEEQDQRGLYGVEFEPLPPDEEAQLGMLLQLLLTATGQGRRAHPRVATRVEVTCRTESIFRGWVSDLSKGGLAIKSVRDVVVGSSIDVSFGVRGLRSLVEVSGQVVSNQQVEGGYRLGVNFVPLTAMEQAQVARTLDLLLDIALPDGEVVEDDE
ncbi:MAG: PilZ domain-containing protein [Archangium sp.]|nr:PilZ domain-containing protein [Archangium sp.]MDP3573218.1 PilZ domain-containing protein [Archangium sp.]